MFRFLVERMGFTAIALESGFTESFVARPFIEGGAGNRSLLWFTVWSGVVHAGIMAVQSIVYPEHRGHLLGDVPALLLVAAVLAFLVPRRTADSTWEAVARTPVKLPELVAITDYGFNQAGLRRLNSASPVQ